MLDKAMRKYINLIESASQVFYHGSRKKFPVGFVLLPQSEGYVNGEGAGQEDFEREAHFRCEDIIERYRPVAAPKRSQSVYLVSDPEEIDYAGGYDDYIYTVEPHNTPWKANLHWYSTLYGECFDDEEPEAALAEKLALSYWNAVPSGDHTLFEFLCTAATVVKVDAGE